MRSRRWQSKMKRLVPLAALALALPALAADYPPTPAEIVAAAPAAEWTAIDPADLLVMDLAPDRDGNARRVVIQLMPAPFSLGWVENIRKLAKVQWWDGTAIYRVQDNYVVQWGALAEEKVLPNGLNISPEAAYLLPLPEASEIGWLLPHGDAEIGLARDHYAFAVAFRGGWPIGGDNGNLWPLHCYGMVGVARGIENTGTGADLYAVIGHAPRQLDRNIALVGRVIEGIEHLSSLPRGKGELGFYEDDEAEKRVPILSVRLGPEASGLPGFEYLSTDSASFAAYAHARANRQDAFYKVPAGGADICNVPVPIRRIAG